MQQCTGVVEDSVQPEYNEEFSFCLAAPDIVGKVLKLSLMDHDSSGKRVVGFSVLALDSCGLGEGELSVKEVWLVISCPCHITSWPGVAEHPGEGDAGADPPPGRQVGRCPGVRLDQGCLCRLELSLRYDTQHGRLTLGILSLRISAVND